MTTSPQAFAPGAAAVMNNKRHGTQNRDSRAVDAKGAPAILRMGHLHRFLSGSLGDDSGYVDYGNDFVDPVYIDTQLVSTPWNTFQAPIPTQDSFLPSTLTPPAAIATITPPSAQQQNQNANIITSLLQAGTTAFKASQGSPTTTMTPAHLAELRAAAAQNSFGTPLIPGITNQHLLLYGAIAALGVFLVSQR